MPISAPETESIPFERPLLRTGVVDRTAAAHEQIAAIREGRHPGGCVDWSGLSLIGEDLSCLDLMAANLTGADLSRCNLKNANLFGAQMAGATLFEANMSGAELSGSNLEGANLEGANLQHTGLGMSKLAGASLTRAEMEGVTLTEADLTGADLRRADLHKARARNVNFTDADLSRSQCIETEFDGSNVKGAVFNGACLRSSSLSGLQGYKEASWIGADMRDIDFTGAYLCRRFANDQNFIAEFKRQSRWSKVLYYLWSFTSDCGRSVARWSLCTAAIVVVFACLYTTVGISYGDHQTWLSPLYFSVVTMTTLGYGDVLPSSVMGQVVAMCEVVTGYVMLGGLLSIFSNKMASRAD